MPDSLKICPLWMLTEVPGCVVHKPERQSSQCYCYHTNCPNYFTKATLDHTFGHSEHPVSFDCKLMCKGLSWLACVKAGYPLRTSKASCMQSKQRRLKLTISVEIRTERVEVGCRFLIRPKAPRSTEQKEKIVNLTVAADHDWIPIGRVFWSNAILQHSLNAGVYSA